jgi:hypothetical protein
MDTYNHILEIPVYFNCTDTYYIVLAYTGIWSHKIFSLKTFKRLICPQQWEKFLLLTSLLFGGIISEYKMFFLFQV